jgi:hypothetical protein
LEIHRNVDDDELRVPGIDGLWVNALMSSAVTSTNASATAMMVAVQGAAMTGAKIRRRIAAGSWREVEPCKS